MSMPNANQAQQKVAIPDPLQPGENYADWHTCLRPDALIMAKNFAKLYRLKLEAGVASLLVTAAHSLGDSLQVALPHTNLSPPFNLLTVTAEPDPIWTEVPLKFLKTGIEDIVEAQLRIQQARAESKSDEKSPNMRSIPRRDFKRCRKRQDYKCSDAWSTPSPATICDLPSSAHPLIVPSLC